METNKKRPLSMISVAAVAGLIFSACAGTDGENAVAHSDGFEFGAPQETVNEVISGLEDVTLNYQPAAGSPDSGSGRTAIAFKDAVEERSNGKIEIELIWGQAVADFDEVPAALADGRLDMAQPVFVYDPGSFPVYNALANALSGLPTSPVAGEAIDTSVTTELAWNNQNLLDEYEANDLVPLNPMLPSGAIYSICATPSSEGTDWSGRQVRVSSEADHAVANETGMIPVSMSHVEMFEALQRGTVDCTFAQFSTTAESGLLEVAPHITETSEESSIAARAGAADMAGPTFRSLPVAYQQIIFDAINIETTASRVENLAASTAIGVETAKEYGGELNVFDDSTDASIQAAGQALREEGIEAGHLNEDFDAEVESAVERWRENIRNLGLEDEGELDLIDEWWDPDAIDYDPWATELFETAALPHRPN